jgi:nitrate/TMAO reductase-like tetraheme cytochrome c subunit
MRKLKKWISKFKAFRILYILYIGENSDKFLAKKQKMNQNEKEFRNAMQFLEKITLQG